MKAPPATVAGAGVGGFAPAAVWMALQTLPGVGRTRLVALMKRFTAHEVWEAPPAVLAGVEGVGRQVAQAMAGARTPALLAAAGAALERAGCQVLIYCDPDYPSLLHHISVPPPMLFCLGRLPPGPMVAVVGARRPTSYGLSTAYRFGRDLARAGYTVVSGMARGIDSAAHRGALDAGGATVAVLGSGVDVIYPREETALYRRIMQQGAVLSEQPPGAPPLPYHFVARNRIISGLSKGVIVVEATKRSGALHTAGFAGEQGRDVMAVPGPLSSRLSDGPNDLMADGACLVRSVEDVAQVLGLQPLSLPAPGPSRPVTEAAAAAVLSLLQAEPLGVDDLNERTAMPVPTLLSALGVLELSGLVRRLPDQRYEPVH